MPKYLVTATAFKRAEGSEAYSPRTFTFEVNLSEPWSAKNAPAVGDLAFTECHRVFGFWPKHNPQIDNVVLVQQPFFDALVAIAELANGADRMDTWDHISAHDILALIPTEVYVPIDLTQPDWSYADEIEKPENTETPQPETEADDLDELI